MEGLTGFDTAVRWSGQFTVQQNATVLKVVSLMRRAEGMSKQEFLTWITEEHVRFAREIPGLRKFVVNATDADADTPWDSVNELCFDDDAGRVAAFASEQGKA